MAARPSPTACVPSRLPGPLFRIAAFVIASALLTPFPATSRGDEPAKPSARPNVILILADDLGWADLGCYGSTFHRTPHLDRMAKQGVRFTDAYAAACICSPSRAAIMTGKWPARLHLTDWLPGRNDMSDQPLARPTINQELPLEETTIAEVLAKAGYVTAHIGKWHLGNVGFEPEKQGFEINIAGDRSGSPASYFAPFRRPGRAMPGLEDAKEGEYLTDRLTDEACSFIDKHHDRPFFLYFPHYTVHIPLTAKAEYIQKYPQKMIPGKQSNAIYAAMIESLDESVGRVLDKLAEHKIDEQTLVIFASDNGGLSVLEGPHTPPTINSPLREGKGFLYEGGIRTPLIARWPGKIPQNRVTATLASSQDLFGTIVEATGAKADVPPDGKSLLGVLTDRGGLDRDTLYWHYPHYSNQGGEPTGAVREGDYKLIEYYDTGRLELYNLRKDIGETRNIVEDEPHLARRLADKLAAWRKDVGAQMPTPNPGYRHPAQAKNGSITLPARRAHVEGTQLRYEYLPHKSTLGYWTRAEDTAEWLFTVSDPGTFRVTALVGCGTGQGGSEVEFRIAGKSLDLTVPDTGGFQNFKPVEVGSVTLDKPGEYTLLVRPKRKAKAAVMDLRQVVLTPVKANE